MKSKFLLSGIMLLLSILMSVSDAGARDRYGRSDGYNRRDGYRDGYNYGYRHRARCQPRMCVAPRPRVVYYSPRVYRSRYYHHRPAPVYVQRHRQHHYRY